MRAERALWAVFLATLLLVGWGKILIPLGSKTLSIGGSTRGLFMFVFPLYLAARTMAGGWGRPTLHRDPLVWLFAVAAASVVWNPGHHLENIWETIFPAFAAYCIARWLLEKDADRGVPLLRVLVAALTAVVAYNLVVEPASLLFLKQIDTSEHHTHAAMRLVLALPITVGLLQVDRPPRGGWSFLYLLQILMQIVGLVASGSRIGWIAFGAVGLYALVAQTSRMARVAFVVAVLGVVTLAVVAPAVRANFATLGSLGREENFWHRYLIYTVSGRLFLEHPVVGIGYSHDTFTEMGRQLVPGYYYRHPHNLVLYVAVFLGYVGLIPLALVVVRTLKRMERIVREGSMPTPLVEGIAGGLLGFAVVNVAESALSSERVTLLATVLLALLASWRNEGPGRDGANPRSP